MKKKIKITNIEIKHLSKLAMLEISNNESRKYAEQLDKIIDYVSKLDEVDLNDIEPLYYVLEQDITGRIDDIEDTLNIENVLKNAPDSKADLFKVPPVINGKNKIK